MMFLFAMSFALFAADMDAVRSADRFVDSVGVNVHLSYWGTPYGKRFPEVATILERSGIRHLRDGMVLGQRRVCDEGRELAASGLHFIYITQPSRNARDLRTWASCVGNAIEGYEAPNEYDISHPKIDVDWVDTLRTFQQNLYGWVKADAMLRQLAVIGPSLTSKGAAERVGDLSAFLDVGNTHDYFGGHEPETPGYGSGGYGSISFNLQFARLVAGDRPIYATETGYGTDDDSANIPEDVQAAYVPRMFLEQFAAGIQRTYEYELVDEGGPPFSAMGLLDKRLRPKPAFTALTGMLDLLEPKSKGTAAASQSEFPLELTGSNAAIKHIVFQRGDGTIVLAVWQGASSIEPKTRFRLNVNPADVGLTVPSGWVIRSVHTYGADYALQTIQVNSGSTQLHLGTTALFVEIRKH